MNVMKWLVCSPRTLSLAEVAEVFLIDLGNPRLFETKYRHKDVKYVQEILSGLVSFDKNNYVCLSHTSVREYLTGVYLGSDENPQSPLPGEQAKAKFTDNEARLHVAHCCLLYILRFKSTPLEANTSLLEYARAFWMTFTDALPHREWPEDFKEKGLRLLHMRSPDLFNEITIVTGAKVQVSEAIKANHPGWLHNSLHNRMMLTHHPYRFTAQLGSLQLTDMLLSKNKYIVQEDLDILLQDASTGGNIDLVKLLLKKGASLHTRSDSFGDALQAAAASEDVAIAKLLLDHGADVNARHPDWRTSDVFRTAMECAAAFGNINMLRLLVDYGADTTSVCSHDRDAECVFSLAAAGGYYTTLEFLLSQGLIMDKEKCTALHEAATKGFLDIIQLLIKHQISINVQSGERGSPLNAAIRAKREEVIDFLLSHGADINGGGAVAGTALHMAALGGDNKMVRRLLALKADPDATCELHGSVLAVAYELGNGETAELLLEKGASILEADVKTDGGILQRIVFGHHEKVEFLSKSLKEGAKVNVIGGSHGTALPAACQFERAKAVRMLLDHGADVHLVAGRHRTVLQAPMAGKFTEAQVEIIHMLLERGAALDTTGGKFGSVWHTAVSRETTSQRENVLLFKILELLLSRGVDVNDARGTKHPTALQAVLKSRSARVFLKTDLEKMHFFLDHGADPNLSAGLYGLPLQWVSASGFLAKLAAFMDATNGAVDVNGRSGLYNTALQAAAHVGAMDVCKYLLEKGADVNIRGGKYGSALNAAVFAGYWDVVEELLEAGATRDCDLRRGIDEKWLIGAIADIEEGQRPGYEQRYRKFWEVESARERVGIEARGGGLWWVGACFVLVCFVFGYWRYWSLF